MQLTRHTVNATRHEQGHFHHLLQELKQHVERCSQGPGHREQVPCLRLQDSRHKHLAHGASVRLSVAFRVT
ncbi:hypothetical protein LSAT2_028123 [Lamellibrachia satsuma]|nr:hypothetical protein LSAT2_028123 [Lamellibrachia satsuma]